MSGNDERLDQLMSDLRQEILKLPEGFRCYSRLIFYILLDIRSKLRENGTTPQDPAVSDSVNDAEGEKVSCITEKRVVCNKIHTMP